MSPVVEEELLLHVLLSRPLEQSLGISSCIPPGTRPYRTFQTTTNNTLAFFLENTLPRCITVGMCNWLCRVPWHSSLPRSLCFEVGRVGVQCSIGSTYVHISMIYVYNISNCLRPSRHRAHTCQKWPAGLGENSVLCLEFRHQKIFKNKTECWPFFRIFFRRPLAFRVSKKLRNLTKKAAQNR